eukprot:scaffold1610_cov257-Pinguiococcus_pyrenoidosus.AAC.2
MLSARRIGLTETNQEPRRPLAALILPYYATFALDTAVEGAAPCGGLLAGAARGLWRGALPFGTQILRGDLRALRRVCARFPVPSASSPLEKGCAEQDVQEHLAHAHHRAQVQPAPPRSGTGCPRVRVGRVRGAVRGARLSPLLHRHTRAGVGGGRLARRGGDPHHAVPRQARRLPEQGVQAVSGERAAHGARELLAERVGVRADGGRGAHDPHAAAGQEERPGRVRHLGRELHVPARSRPEQRRQQPLQQW